MTTTILNTDSPQPDDSSPSAESSAAMSSDSPAELDFFHLLEGTLLAPKATFAAVPAHQWPIALKSLGWLAITAIIVLLATHVWKEDPIATDWLAFNSLWAAVTGVVTVFILTAVVRGFAGVFHQPCSYRQLLSLLCLSGLPWLLYAPLALLKVGLPFIGGLAAFFVGLGLWGWQLILFAMALSAGFKITLGQAVAFMLLPLGMTWWLTYATGELFTIFIGRLLP